MGQGAVLEFVQSLLFFGSSCKAIAPHSSTFAWKIPWMEEPSGLQSMGLVESDTTERLHFHFSLSCLGEGNGNPLQCSCLENPKDRGAWWAAIYGVAQSQTRLKRQQQQQQQGLQCFSACASQSPRFGLDCKQCPLWAAGGAGDTAAALRFPAVINDPRAPAILKHSCHRGLGLFQSPHCLPACTTPIRGPVSAELPQCGGRGALWLWHSSG